MLPPDCLSLVAHQLLFPHPFTPAVWPVGQGTCMSPVALCVPDQDAVHTPTHATGAAFLEKERYSLPSWLCHSSSTLGRHWAGVIQRLEHRDFDVYFKTSKPPIQLLTEHELGKLCGQSPSMIFWDCSYKHFVGLYLQKTWFKEIECKEKLEMATVAVGSFGAFSFLLMLQEISTGSYQSTDDTFNPVYFFFG